MINKYTPGPWRIGNAGHTVFGPKTDNPSPKTVAHNLSRANARLIAAAPALLAALKAIEGVIDDAVDMRIRSGRLPPIANLLSTIQDEARAAIEAAKGNA